ncbi:NTP transferase domain-containing protein [Candidatus Pacearchaeota archaeon]|nr:NTP transferase domain-containing protein [Candidatus Pacearchaeota archaeon]
MKSIILAGGFGTRLREVVKDLPKPMALIAGKPFLEHQIDYLRDQGLNDITLCVHYKSDNIKSYFGDGGRFGVNLTYSQEEVPLGTGGAIKLAQKYIDDTFFVLNGDSYSDVNLSDFNEFHNTHKGLASMVLTRSDNVKEYGSVMLTGDKITDFLEKSGSPSGLVNRGIYLFNPEIFKQIPEGKKVSLENELFPNLARQGDLYGQVHDGYFMDIGRPETYERFRQDFLKKLQTTDNRTVREAMKILDLNRTDLLLITCPDGKLQGVLNDNIIRRYLINGGDVDENVSKAMVKHLEKIGRTSYSDEENFNILLSGTRHLPILDDNGRIADIRFHNEEIEVQKLPVVRGKVPLRISFAGGGTDIPYFFEKYGGVVISTTIDKYCHLTAARRADSKLVIESDMLENELVLDTKDLKYDGNFDLVKAVFNVVKPNFGVDLYLHNDVPPRRGLGSSASLAVLVTQALGELQGRRFDDESLAETAYRVEVDELNIRGGKQDQYVAVFGGFNWMEFVNGDKKIMHPLRLKDSTIDELKSHLTLCYTGSQHYSSEQHKSQEKSFQEDEAQVTRKLQSLKDVATGIKENLLSATPNFERIGELLHESWERKRELSPHVTNEKIDRLYDLGIKSGIFGGKLLGSGGGGYLLFFHPPKKKNQLVKMLASEGGEILDFNFEQRGSRVWPVES